jgi:hypothetical protein
MGTFPRKCPIPSGYHRERAGPPGLACPGLGIANHRSWACRTVPIGLATGNERRGMYSSTRSASDRIRLAQLVAAIVVAAMLATACSPGTAEDQADPAESLDEPDELDADETEADEGVVDPDEDEADEDPDDPQVLAATLCTFVQRREADAKTGELLELRISNAANRGVAESTLREALDAECSRDIDALSASELQDARDQQIGFALTLEVARDLLAEDIERSRDADSVDRLEYVIDLDDDTQAALFVSVTSGWAGDDRQRDAAWSIVRSLTFLWDNAFWANMEREPLWWPNLDLTVDSHRYECDGETMRELAERRLDRAGWEAACS